MLDEVADFGALHLIHGIHQADHAVGRFHDHVVGHHFPAAEGFIGAVLGVDGDADRHILVVVTLFRSRSQRRFHRLDDDLTVDAFFVGDRFHDQ